MIVTARTARNDNTWIAYLRRNEITFISSAEKEQEAVAALALQLTHAGATAQEQPRNHDQHIRCTRLRPNVWAIDIPAINNCWAIYFATEHPDKTPKEHRRDGHD